MPKTIVAACESACSKKPGPGSGSQAEADRHENVDARYPGNGYAYLGAHSRQINIDIEPHQAQERIPLMDLHQQSQGDGAEIRLDECSRCLRFLPSGDCQKDSAPEPGDVVLMHSGDDIYVQIGAQWCCAGSDGDAFYRGLLAGVRQVPPKSLALDDVIDSTRTPIAMQVDRMENNGGHPMAGSAKLRTIFTPGQWDCAYEEQIAAAATKSELWGGDALALWIGWCKPTDAPTKTITLAQSISSWMSSAYTETVGAVKDIWNSPKSSWLSEAQLCSRWEMRYDEIVEALRTFPARDEWSPQEWDDVMDYILKATAHLASYEAKQEMRMLAKVVQHQSAEDTLQILFGWWTAPESSDHRSVREKAAHLRSSVLHAALSCARLNVSDGKEILRMHENCTLLDLYRSIARIDVLRAGSNDPRVIATSLQKWQCEWMTGEPFKLRQRGWKASGVEFLAQSGAADVDAFFQKSDLMQAYLPLQRLRKDASALGGEHSDDPIRDGQQHLESITPVSYAMRDSLKEIEKNWNDAVGLFRVDETDAQSENGRALPVSREKRATGDDRVIYVEWLDGELVICSGLRKLGLDDVMTGGDKDFVRDFRSHVNEDNAVNVVVKGHTVDEIVEALHLDKDTVLGPGYSSAVTVDPVQRDVTAVCTIDGRSQARHEDSIPLTIKRQPTVEGVDPGTINVRLFIDPSMNKEEVRSAISAEIEKSLGNARNNYCQRNEWSVLTGQRPAVSSTIRLGERTLLDLDAIRRGAVSSGESTVYVRKLKGSNPVELQKKNIRVDRGYFRNMAPYYSLSETEDASTLQVRQVRRFDVDRGKCEVPNFVDITFRNKDWGPLNGRSRTALREFVQDTNLDIERHRVKTTDPEIIPAFATKNEESEFRFELPQSRHAMRTMYWGHKTKLVLPTGLRKGTLLLKSPPGEASVSDYNLDLCGLMREDPKFRSNIASNPFVVSYLGDQSAIYAMKDASGFADAMKSTFDREIAKCAPSEATAEKPQPPLSNDVGHGQSEGALLHAHLDGRTTSGGLPASMTEREPLDDVSGKNLRMAENDGERVKAGSHDLVSSQVTQPTTVRGGEKSGHVLIGIEDDEEVNSSEVSGSRRNSVEGQIEHDGAVVEGETSVRDNMEEAEVQEQGHVSVRLEGDEEIVSIAAPESQSNSLMPHTLSEAAATGGNESGGGEISDHAAKNADGRENKAGDDRPGSGDGSNFGSEIAGVGIASLTLGGGALAYYAAHRTVQRGATATAFEGATKVLLSTTAAGMTGGAAAGGAGGAGGGAAAVAVGATSSFEDAADEVTDEVANDVFDVGRVNRGDYEGLENLPDSEEMELPESPTGSGYSTQSPSLSELSTEDESSFSLSASGSSSLDSVSEWTSPFPGRSFETISLNSLASEAQLGPLEEGWNPLLSAWPEATESGAAIQAKRVAMGVGNLFVTGGTLLGSYTMLGGEITMGAEGQALGGVVVGLTNIVETLEAAGVIDALTPQQTYVLNVIQQGGGIIVTISSLFSLKDDVREFRNHPSVANGVSVCMEMLVVLGAAMGQASSAEKLGAPIENGEKIALAGTALNATAATGHLGAKIQEEKSKKEQRRDQIELIERLRMP